MSNWYAGTNSTNSGSFGWLFKAGTSAQTLTPSLFSNSQSFYSPTVTQASSPQTLTPSLYTNGQTYYAPTVVASNALLPGLYTNAQAFYSPVVSQPGTAQSLFPGLYTNTQSFYTPVVSLDTQIGGGGGGVWHKAKPRSFRREKSEREDLRLLIKRAIDPIVATEAKVVTVGNKVAVLTETGALAAIPVPPAFDAKAVSVMVASMLAKAGIEPQRVRSANARRQAEEIIERIKIDDQKRLTRRRQEEELLLLA